MEINWLIVVYVFIGLEFQINILFVFVQLEDCWYSKIPNCQKFLLLQKADLFQLSTFQFILPPQPSTLCPVLPCCHSAVRLTVHFEPLIPTVMTSSGTWRLCLQCPRCLLKDFATSCETRAVTERGADCPLVKSPDGRVHTKPSRQDEKDSNLQGEALSLGAMMGWDGGQKVPLIATLFDSHSC